MNLMRERSSGRTPKAHGVGPCLRWRIRETMQMNRRPRLWLTSLVFALMVLGVSLWSGCSQDLMGEDNTPPTGSEITNPADGQALSNPVINIRGRAEVGATVEIYVNDVKKGSAIASPAVPPDGPLGRFTVENVELGEEGPKVIRGVVTDLYGNRADRDLVANITLDMTPPPAVLEMMTDSEWQPAHNYWKSGEVWATAIGRTDTTAAGTRMRQGINEFLAESTYVFPATPHDSVRAWIPVRRPPLTVANPDSIVRYYFEAFDEAGNVTGDPVTILWEAAGKETALAWDDSEYDQNGDQESDSGGTRYAVRFSAPAWANYITGMEIYTGIDGETNPIDPMAPSTRPFIAWIWKPAGDLSPGDAANQGHEPFGFYGYPENELVRFYFPSAIDITNDAEFPSKQFLAGIELEYKLNPYIRYDTDPPIDRMAYKYTNGMWGIWGDDLMIHAIVSDLDAPGGRSVVLRDGEAVPLESLE